MDIRIDDNAGYCFGVVKAIGAAEDELSRNGSLYCLGDIVHNSAEVERLRRLGLVVIDHSRLSSLPGSKVLIRAHGEPPETYRTARQLGIQLIDATCPIVLALQQRIRKGYDEMQRVGGQIVIFGKPGHAEVVGLTGQTDGSAIIVSNPSDLDAIDFSRPIRLFSQTTKSREEYQQLIDNITEKLSHLANQAIKQSSNQTIKYSHIHKFFLC
jgi:4-hydroxy-3-methylbut-2-enyl diphosphate reductase